MVCEILKVALKVPSPLDRYDGGMLDVNCFARLVSSGKSVWEPRENSDMSLPQDINPRSAADGVTDFCVQGV